MALAGSSTECFLTIPTGSLTIRPSVDPSSVPTAAPTMGMRTRDNVVLACPRRHGHTWRRLLQYKKYVEKAQTEKKAETPRKTHSVAKGKKQHKVAGQVHYKVSHQGNASCLRPMLDIAYLVSGRGAEYRSRYRYGIEAHVQDVHPWLVRQ